MNDVMIFDDVLAFTQENITRLTDIGVKTILAFNNWHTSEPQPGEYHFDETINYARMCKKAGIKLLLQTPQGTPAWAPEDWYLINGVGQSNNIPITDVISYGQRFFSYWNLEAQEYTDNYIRKVREIVEPEGATCISCIGPCGEYMFPSAFFYLHYGMVPCPWWFDKNAIELRGDEDHVKWFIEERRKIVAHRLSLYKEKWLQFVPYDTLFPWSDWQIGNVGIDKVFEENKDGLRSILFTVFLEETWLELARIHAQKYPTWCGAEGCGNVIFTTQTAIKLGFKGTLCGPLVFGNRCFEDWMYENLKVAIEQHIDL